MPFFGATTGFIVSYTPDCSVRFDINGTPVEEFNRAYCPGEVALTVGRKTIPAEKLLELGRRPRRRLFWHPHHHRRVVNSFEGVALGPVQPRGACPIGALGPIP